MDGPRRLRRQAGKITSAETIENIGENPTKKRLRKQTETSVATDKSGSNKQKSKDVRNSRKKVQQPSNNEQNSTTAVSMGNSVCCGIQAGRSKVIVKAQIQVEKLQCNEQCNVKCNEDSTDSYVQQLLHSDFNKRPCELNLLGFQYAADVSINLVHHFHNLNLGIKRQIQLKKAVTSPCLSTIKELSIFRTASPFDRRVTALEWHPSNPRMLAVGSKGGDILLWDTEAFFKEKTIKGLGAAGSCQAMKFWPWDLSKMVTSSINGTVTLHDFDLEQGQVLADTMDSYDHWYCSIDVCRSRYLVVAGRNNGTLHMMSTEGRKVFEYRLHKNKITHVEFSPREDWLLCTASTDRTVQMWDVRYLKDRRSALCVLPHERAVNSAYFSMTDGSRLLSTDQDREIRVYRAPDWHLETRIHHPHRFFQHITPFKATWHPLRDLIVCGRYPDAAVPGSTGKELKTLDVFDADTGEMAHQLYNPDLRGLCPLNKFNYQGDALASGMGFHILLWNRNFSIQQKQTALMNSVKSSLGLDYLNSLDQDQVSQRSRLSQGSQRSNPRSRRTQDDPDDLKKRKRMKTGEKSIKESKTSNVKKPKKG